MQKCNFILFYMWDEILQLNQYLLNTQNAAVSRDIGTIIRGEPRSLTNCPAELGKICRRKAAVPSNTVWMSGWYCFVSSAAVKQLYHVQATHTHIYQ